MLIRNLCLGSFASVVLLCSCMVYLVQPITIFTDESTLLDFKAQISHDPNYTLDHNWTTATSFCNWIGVVCSSRRQRVTSLNLANMGLEGTISPHVGNLSFLISFNISNNSFHGRLPNQLGHLHRLKLIDLQFNKFNGEVPAWLGFLPRLHYLLLSNNYLTGTIPPSLGNITNLEWLSLGNNSLAGKIPEEIGNLSMLGELYLNDNKLIGVIPQEIFSASSLQVIYLSRNMLFGNLPMDMCYHLPTFQVFDVSFNQLGGQIPSNLCNCTKLQYISLLSNNFNGSMPREIGNLSMLRYLNLYRNRLTGTIPPSIGNLSMLELLYISDNNFYGNIPQELGHLSHLRFLVSHNNNFKGEIPQSIFNISTLDAIDFAFNHFSGHLPSSIGLWLPNLSHLYLGINNFSGIIPTSISNASKLVDLDLSYNFFTGLLPTTLGNLKVVQWINLIDNQLTNEPSTPKLTFLTSLTNCKFLRVLWIGYNPLNVILPDSIGNLSISMERFGVQGSGIKGTIPSGIGNLSNLISINLYENDLIGSIPTTMGRLSKLQQFGIQDNKIQGTIPTELCQLRHLDGIDLSKNRFSGSIPNCLGNLSLLRSIYLSYNALTSKIPPTLWSLNNILRINFSYNSLTGHMPLEVGKLKAVLYMDLSGNQLSGNIPSAMGDLLCLQGLYLSRNKLQGHIPQSFGHLISLQSMDLSHNNLSGEIPKTLEALSYLRNLNVSFNRLQGEIPSRGPFANFTAVSFIGNDDLCGVPRLHVPPCKGVARPKARTKFLLLKYIFPIIVFIILAVAIISLLVMHRRRRGRFPIQAELSFATTHRRISYQELVQATNDFDESNLLGVGSFSSVYKGVLTDRTITAIKVFNLEFQAAFRSFDAECEVMRNICHRNLVKIISSYSNTEFRALILEYMPNGSLDKWLYSYNYYLDFMQRLNIMLDVASALEYLHHDYSTSVVHCDLKPNNVLLDEDMVGHVCDFGIAKLLQENESTKQTETLGTLGYVAPEYGLDGRVSTAGDVYSFGFMVMETFTRKKPTDEMFVGELSLKNWVKESLPDAVMEVVDANLLGSEEEDFTVKKHCVTSIMQLALECCAKSPEDRIKMNDAVVRLKKIKREYLSNVEGV